MSSATERVLNAPGKTLEEPSEAVEIIGESAAAQEIRRFAHRAAHSEFLILLLGETGVGKDLLAKYIHSLGRPNEPFIMVNCGAIPRELCEGELFGHRVGAFTGAQKSQTGLVKQAENGTLFLDEVANMDWFMQAKFLSFVEGKKFRPIGNDKEYAMKTRIIAATNVDPEKAIQEKALRPDLYYRLNKITLVIPPLRERREDIPLLVNHFLIANNCTKQVTPEAMEMLKAYYWPGNIRELSGLVEKLVFFTHEEPVINQDVLRSLLKLNPGQSAPSPPLLDLDATVRQYLIQVLRETKGHRALAATIANVSLRNLYRKISDLKIKEEEYLNESILQQ